MVILASSLTFVSEIMVPDNLEEVQYLIRDYTISRKRRIPIPKTPLL